MSTIFFVPSLSFPVVMRRGSGALIMTIRRQSCTCAQIPVENTDSVRIVTLSFSSWTLRKQLRNRQVRLRIAGDDEIPPGLSFPEQRQLCPARSLPDGDTLCEVL